MNTTIKKIQDKKIIILSGACGTEIQRRGVPTPLPLWSTAALITHPDVVRQIHEDYIHAGAQIITANTFRTNVRALRAAGIVPRAKELTTLAVRLALEARKDTNPDVLIAGSQGPVEDCYRPDLVPPDDQLKEEHGTHAQWLKEAGVDFIMIETMNSTREARVAAAAAKNLGLPFAVSFVCNKDGNLLSGETIKEAVGAVNSYNPVALLVNCMPAELITQILPKLRMVTNLPVGVYGQGEGEPAEHTGWEFTNSCNSGVYADCAKKWVEDGATLIGGCCGTTPEYITAICTALSQEQFA